LLPESKRLPESADLLVRGTSASIFVSAQDGLKLHVRRWGPRANAALPVMCLPGLARTGADFEVLASALAGDAKAPRPVFALDARGRGQSAYDRTSANYNVVVELGDVLAVLSALGIARAVFVGTSRGGLVTMLLGAARPAAIAGCVLNDIGPVIEVEGLMRIKSYVGKLPQAANFEDAAHILRQLFGSQFPRLRDEDWVAFARRVFKESRGRIVPDYDVKLAAALKGLDAGQPLPPMWREFDSLARVPMMVIRGGHSDILSAATVDAMRARREQLELVEVPDEGHAPLLADAETIARIAAFVARCDSA
jgi:pimeloyl-ACP methyl ester carboxylesterase